MYAYIRGEIAESNPAFVIIDAGGVGYHINISLNTFAEIEKLDKTKLYIHHIQREDVQALYGFVTKEERDYFGHLLSVSGVGPNTARMVLSSLKTEELRLAVVNNDVAALKRVKGVGPKTAQRMLIDLKDKIELVSGDELLRAASGDNTAFQEALSALIALGFPRVKASSALNEIKKQHSEVPSVEVLLKAALRSLS